jgi:hypothetical protein
VLLSPNVRKRRTATGKLPPDIVVQVKEDFRAEASQALMMLTQSLPQAARVIRCLVFLANGDLQLLSSLMTAADPLDVIFWAEYVNHAADRPKRVRDLRRPFPHAGERSLPADVARFLRRSRSRRT